MHDGVEWRAQVEIPPTFPEDMPRLNLEVCLACPGIRLILVCDEILEILGSAPEELVSSCDPLLQKFMS